MIATTFRHHICNDYKHLQLPKIIVNTSFSNFVIVIQFAIAWEL